MSSRLTVPPEAPVLVNQRHAVFDDFGFLHRHTGTELGVHELILLAETTTPVTTDW